MTFLNYVQPEDIVHRLMRRRLVWFTIPSIVVDGNENEFGTLRIKFGSDGQEKWKIYIKDKYKVYAAASYAIINFAKIIDTLYKDSDC